MNNLDLFQEVADKIVMGEFDSHLISVSVLILERQEKVKNQKGFFSIGDRVVLNAYVRNKKMVGRKGVVVKVNPKQIQITFDEPFGKFVRVDSTGVARSGIINVPRQLVDKI